MCGLFGAYSGYLNKQELANVRTLGILSQFRGIDSTGIAVVSRRKNKLKVDVHKDIVDSSNFFWYSKQADELLDSNGPSVVIGHCRAATHGSVNETNAHPLQERHITGVHNGTIDRFAPKHDEKDTMSDSRLLMRNISYHGLFPTLREAGFSGAWAVVYFDHSNGTLNFIRNAKRPLWFMYNKGRSTLYWASEKRMLDFVAAADPSAFNEPLLIKEDLRITYQVGNMNPRTEVFNLYQPSAPVVSVPAATEKKEEGNKAHAIPFLDKRAAIKARLQAKRDAEAAERVASGASVPIVPLRTSAPTSTPATDTSGTTTTPVASEWTKPGCGDACEHKGAVETPPPFDVSPAENSSTSSTQGQLPLLPTKKDTLRAKDFKDLHEYMDKVSKTKSSSSSQPRYRGFGGKIISIKEARNVMEEGCEFCHDPQVPLNDMFWVSHKTFVCSDCLSDDRLSEIYGSSLISKGEILYDN